MHATGSRFDCRLSSSVLAIAAVAALSGCASDRTPAPASPARRAPTLTAQQSGTKQRLQALSAVDARVVWASGLGGTYAITTDGGATWRARVMPGGEALEFRDVHAVSESVAYLMAAGVGPASRIYKTVDGGATWTLQFQNPDPKGFNDCFAFWSPTRAIAMADSLGGRIPAIETVDGAAWREIGDRLPPALAGEAAFAASGTCVATQGSQLAWIATGGAERARVLATTDGGRTWTAHDTPLVQGSETSGGFSVAFRDRSHGMLGGGDLSKPTELSNNVARSRDGGRTWELASRTPFPGAIFGLAYAAGQDERIDRGRIVVATGPGGAAWTPDEGDTWVTFAGVTGYWAVGFAGPRDGWLVGTEGRILKISF